MKVAVNKCFGGFSLSTLLIQEYLKKKGKECFVYEGIDSFKKVAAQGKSSLFSNILLKDYGDEIDDIPYDSNDYFSMKKDDNDFRTDPDLISTIEELGESASGQCGNIQIVEIPDGVDFEIHDYDGIETIHEIHRSW